MRIELVEKIILFLAGLAVLAVAAFVTFCSILPGGLRSGIPKVVEVSALTTQDWLDLQRRRAGRVQFGGVPKMAPGQVAVPAAPAAPSAGGGAPEAGGGDEPGSPPTTDYFVSGGDVPQSEQIAGYPWLRRLPNVSYASPQQVPDVLYRKYQSFQETWDLVQEGGGKFVKTDDGKDAYEVAWLDDASYLATRIGLRQGDKVISVNGQPVGQSIGAGKAMFEQMKNERRFAVLIDRPGTGKMVLSFYVQ